MNNISDNEKQGQYDFIWSSCAMEHLGSIKNGIDFVKNSLACLKPGGYAIHTTEFNCQSDEDTLEAANNVIFRKRDLLQLQEDIRPEYHFYDMDFNTGSDPLDYTVDKAPYRADIHIKLLLGNFITTSCIFTIQKKS